jgi:acyl-coenzyme A thioesterase PaaI-like protein
MTAPDMTGWTRYENPGDDFVEHVGPIWIRVEGDVREYAFLPVASHGNPNKVVHGGMLMTFADIALGHPCWVDQGGQATVTASLTLNFVSGARMGELVTCRPEIVRKTRSLYFPRGDLMQGDRCVATAGGVWKIAGAR